MKSVNYKVAAGIGVTSMLMALVGTTCLSKELPGGNLSPIQIFQKARENYAVLASYSDQGQTTIKIDGATTTNPFTIQLSRPDCYLIKWHPRNDWSQVASHNNVQAAWSSGAGGFLETGHGPQCEGGMYVTLDQAASPSGGAAATIPMMFFNIEPGNELDRSTYDEHQQPDDKVGSVNCYVFTRESQGLTKSLWIGKQDLLIHQVRTVISAQAMQASTLSLTKGRPRAIAFRHEYSAVETHTNIVLNQPIPSSKFIPLIQHFAAYNEDN